MVTFVDWFNFTSIENKEPENIISNNHKSTTVQDLIEDNESQFFAFLLCQSSSFVMAEGKIVTNGNTWRTFILFYVSQGLGVNKVKEKDMQKKLNYYFTQLSLQVSFSSMEWKQLHFSAYILHIVIARVRNMCVCVCNIACCISLYT